MAVAGERSTSKAVVVPMPFEDAIRAALETEPEPGEAKPFGKRSGPQAKQKVRSKKK